jgi:hypothetical protein
MSSPRTAVRADPPIRAHAKMGTWSSSLTGVNCWRTAARVEGPRPVRPHARVRSDLAVPDRHQRVPDRAGGACATVVAFRPGRAERRSWRTPHAGVRHPLATAISGRAGRPGIADRHAARAGGGDAAPASTSASRAPAPRGTGPRSRPSTARCSAPAPPSRTSVTWERSPSHTIPRYARSSNATCGRSMRPTFPRSCGSSPTRRS